MVYIVRVLSVLSQGYPHFPLKCLKIEMNTVLLNNLNMLLWKRQLWCTMASLYLNSLNSRGVVVLLLVFDGQQESKIQTWKIEIYFST